MLFGQANIRIGGGLVEVTRFINDEEIEGELPKIIVENTAILEVIGGLVEFESLEER